MLVVILCLCTSVDHVVRIMRVKLLFTIHHQNVKLEKEVVCLSFPCELVGELVIVYHSNSYSVAYEERFVVIHVPCLTSTTVVMLLVNSNSEFRNCFRIVFIFFLKQSLDIVLAMNASMLTEPMQDWKTC